MDWDRNMQIAAPGDGRPPSDNSVGKCNGTCDKQQVVFDRLQIN
jgi:hypothetical protein